MQYRQNVLTCNLALGQETVATRFINRPRSRGATQRARYVELKLRRLADSLILGRGSARLEAT